MPNPKDDDKDQDYYQILELNREALQKKNAQAAQEEIRANYRRLAMAAHPDKGGSTEAMQSLNEAYTVLRDEDRRRSYDLIQTKKVSSGFYAPSPTPASHPPIEGMYRSYEALKPLSEIQAAYNQFLKDKLGDAFPKEHGYDCQIATDPKTGHEVMTITTPNEAAANELIKLLQDKGLIGSRDLALKSGSENTKEPTTPSPFKNPGSTPRLTK